MYQVCKGMSDYFFRKRCGAAVLLPCALRRFFYRTLMLVFPSVVVYENTIGVFLNMFSI